MNNSITPVLLLTGYLGSGKTTLLNRILANRKGIKFAVIVNDIGEVNIDADLIQKGGVVGQQDDSLVPLQNGCICCTLKMDLVEQLRELLKTHKFDYIVIEASGICEPQPIAQTICSIPMMGAEYTADGEARLDSIVSVVDALRLRDEFAGGLDLTKQNIGEEDIENLVIQQIEFCNIILLNKAGEISRQELGRIREILHTLQPKARIIDCNYCDVDLDTLLNTGMFDFNALAASPAWVQEVEKHLDEMEDDEEHPRHEHDHHEHHGEEHPRHRHHGEEHGHHDHHDEEHPHHHHHGPGCTCGHCHHNEETGEAEEYGIGTFVYYARQPFSITEFDQFVARKWPKSVIRAKGICYFHDEEDVCYVFEQAGKQVSLRNAGQWYATMPPEELKTFLDENPGVKRDWDDRYGDRMQKLVFIGQHMNRKEITEMLDACLT
ncbi:MAG: GTP-binding protein [Bacteroidales bacterium]|nr:GTP-binding protein [Bacteroidales bacterium]MCM1148313.1 GTP-binding protein [Bacteroidales bacterium]MCM1206517.1 GTP-binding protein [Bacillota bacterium]MCM1510404.1 GTP-binding protein [Clostridium sp.]